MGALFSASTLYVDPLAGNATSLKPVDDDIWELYLIAVAITVAVLVPVLVTVLCCNSDCRRTVFCRSEGGRRPSGSLRLKDKFTKVPALSSLYGAAIQNAVRVTVTESSP